MPASAADPLASLLAHRNEFVGFLASRLDGNQADAEDVLQHGLVKAIAAAPQLRARDKHVPWFYQILRNALVDHVRARQTAATRDERWATDAAALAPDPTETSRHLCHCLGPLIDSLPGKQASLVRQVDLLGEPVRVVAAAVGLTPSAARRSAMVGGTLPCTCNTMLPE